MSAAGAQKLAATHRQGILTLAGRLAAVLAVSWRQVDASDPLGSWAGAAAAAEGAFVAAQLTAAGMADEFVAASLAVQGARPAGGSVVPDAFAGQAASGLSLADLLVIPAARFVRARRAGVSVRDARAAGGAALTMYARTEVADAARSSVQASMVTQGASGYVRHVGAKCCSRCAVLAGRWYRFSSGFQRHPGCSCGMSPAPRSAVVESPQDLFRQGRITDLTAAERSAVTLGADLGQVVNAKRGLYVAGGEQFTRAGTSMRGVAGARMLARRIAEAGGAAPGGVYANWSVSRREVLEATARYGPLMERGVPFVRRTPAGPQVVSGLFRTAGRPSVAQVMRAGSREQVLRELVNAGYVTTRTREDVASLARP